MRIAVTAVLVASLLGCRTVAPSGSDAVHITRNAADIEHCKPVGAVQTIPPYALPGDDIKEIRNRTVAVGADTVLLNASRSASTRGVAYRCRAT